MKNIVNPLSPETYTQRLRSREEDIRGPYFRDQTAIIHSMPFRRLKHKTQVFFSPDNDHVCTRMEHTLHVATIAAAICRVLGLDVDLAQAISLGHDLGHAPFGHRGEEVLDDLLKDHGGFNHELYALRVVDSLANDGAGLNLTYGVRDGIICHCGEKYEKQIQPRRERIDLNSIRKLGVYPGTYEGCIVRMSDKISYLGRDIEDGIRAGIINEDEVPGNIREILGRKNGEIIDTLVNDLIAESQKTGDISFSASNYQLMRALYDFNTENIYRSAPLEEYGMFCEKILRTLFEELNRVYLHFGRDYPKYDSDPVPLFRRFGRHVQKLSGFYELEKTPAQVIVSDYIAGMTDSYALACVHEVFIPEPIKFDLPRSSN
ncbi:MAG: HD domain-containing protein [bacterium]|nr:HD domain-containing protein [bacterium]